MMETLLSFLPQGVVVYLMAAGAIGLALWRAFIAGRRSEHTRQVNARFAALTEAQEIDRAIDTTDPVLLREELAKWRRP